MSDRAPGWPAGGGRPLRESGGRRRLERLRSCRLLHFAVLGTALYLAQAGVAGRWPAGEWVGGDRDAPPRVLTVTAARRAQLAAEWRLTRGRPPSAAEAAWLVRQWTEEELLYREALRLGLDREHSGVCHRLALNLRFLEPEAAAGRDGPELCRRARELGLDRSDPVIRRQMAEAMRLFLRGAGWGPPPKPPSRAAIEAYVADHPDRFREPAWVRLSHVFVARSEPGRDAVATARRLRARLVAEAVDPRRAVELGDPFLAGHHLPASSPPRLERQLGPAIAAAALEMPVGRWSEPVESAFGVHLVWVHERRAARLRPFEEIARRAARELEAAGAERRLREGLEELRRRWRVEIEPGREGPPIPEASG